SMTAHTVDGAIPTVRQASTEQSPVRSFDVPAARSTRTAVGRHAAARITAHRASVPRAQDEAIAAWGTLGIGLAGAAVAQVGGLTERRCRTVETAVGMDTTGRKGRLA